MRWGMAIELKRCIGCNACVLACKAEHFLPPQIFWNRVLIGEKGKYPQVTKLIYSVRCNHCAEPKCVKVCPTGATQQREDGIVWVDDTKCVGCRYCMVACPYGARSFNYKEQEKEEYHHLDSPPDRSVWGQWPYPTRTHGVVEKCTFCFHRIDKGLKEGKKIGRDVVPACVEACPANALAFGDLDDTGSEVSRLLSTRRPIRLREELDTKCKVYYLLK